MDRLRKIIIDFELQSVQGIRQCFEDGVDPNMIYQNRPLIYELINQYSRGPWFKDCVRAFVDYGLKFDDKVLLAVLLDDAEGLDRLLEQNPQSLLNTYSFDCTFTPLYQASLLHICAEYNHLASARVLVRQGCDVNFRAGIDQHGFGGQTAIFHTVNQHANRSIDMMHFLISQSADLQLTVKGLIWGKGYEWETFIPSVNPVSYAMMGLLRQFQRSERDIYEVVSELLRAAYGIDYTPQNIPNAYLKK